MQTIMEETKIIEAPQIRYHITYDENLTLKDLEDLINLIRISNNDALQEMGISRSKGNDLQRIEKIEPGSIDFVTVLNVVAAAFTIAGYTIHAVNSIIKKIRAEREQDLTGTKRDKKVYYKFPVTINNDDVEMVCFDNSSTYTVNIHIHNNCDKNEIMEILKSNK